MIFTEDCQTRQRRYLAAPMNRINIQVNTRDSLERSFGLDGGYTYSKSATRRRSIYKRGNMKLRFCALVLCVALLRNGRRSRNLLPQERAMFIGDIQIYTVERTRQDNAKWLTLPCICLERNDREIRPDHRNNTLQASKPRPRVPFTWHLWEHFNS